MRVAQRARRVYFSDARAINGFKGANSLFSEARYISTTYTPSNGDQVPSRKQGGKERYAKGYVLEEGCPYAAHIRISPE